MIVIVAPENDYHVRVVRHHLHAMGRRTFVACTDEMAHGAGLSFWPEAPERTEWRRMDGTSVRIGEAGAIWLRRMYPPTQPLDVSDPFEYRFMEREWLSLFQGAMATLDVPMVSHPNAMRAAGKPAQLVQARRVGLSVPGTLITSSPLRASEFLAAGGETVHKAMNPWPGRFISTKVFTDRDVAALSDLELAPTIFQRRIGGAVELRITAVGERMFAAEYEPQFVDGRHDRGAIFRRHALPEEIADKLRALLRAHSLAMATIDMRIDAQGEYQFLELNTQGQYLWIEIHTGMPISRAVAELLADHDGLRRVHDEPANGRCHAAGGRT